MQDREREKGREESGNGVGDKSAEAEVVEGEDEERVDMGVILGERCGEDGDGFGDGRDLSRPGRRRRSSSLRDRRRGRRHGGEVYSVTAS